MTYNILRQGPEPRWLTSLAWPLQLVRPDRFEDRPERQAAVTGNGW